MELREATLLVLGDLIGFQTVTSASNLDLISYADAYLRRAGAQTTITRDRYGQKANLLATIGPPVDGGVVLSGHTDVVPADAEHWTGAPFVASRRDQRVYGRGAVDMKGFIACAMALAPRFAAADLPVPIHIALTFDEEIGCLGAPLLIEELLRTGPRPAVAIVGEPTELRIVDAHKGCYEYTTTFTGVEGHGSAPAKAVNAVEYAVRYVDRLLQLRAELAERPVPDSPFDPPEATISVGTIAGGTARNVVAGSCSLDWEFRSVVRAEAQVMMERVGAFEQELLAQMRDQHPEAALVTETIGAVDGLESQRPSPAIDLVASLLDDVVVDVASFSTEAGLYQQAGIPAVVCGPGSIEVAHQPDEYVTIDQLEKCLTMLERLIPRLRG
jgi:acetylornithine deacetylase